MSNFRKVLKTVLLFILVVALLSAALMATYFGGENYSYQDARERDEVSGTIDFLICGTSHTLRSMESYELDQRLGVNCYNLSTLRATMQGRYELLQKELARNPVDTVVLELSYESLTRNREAEGYEGDFYVLSKINRLPEWISYFRSSIRPSEYISIYYEFLHKGVRCAKAVLNRTWTATNQTSEKGYCDFLYTLDGEKIDGEDEEDTESAKWIASDYTSVLNHKTLSVEPQEENIEYLKKILDLCDEYGVEVILINVPISATCVCRYSNLDVFREWYETLAEEKGFAYYDFNLYKDRADLFIDAEDYHDSTHLNHSGADKFTQLFADVYTMAKNGEDVRDLFFDNYEECKTYLIESSQPQVP